MHVVTKIAVVETSRQKLYEDERDAVAPAIANDPAFKDVHVSQYTGGGVAITGYVPTEADKKRLHEMVARAISERRAEYVMHVSARDERN
jgi:hypothetical protein